MRNNFKRAWESETEWEGMNSNYSRQLDHSRLKSIRLSVLAQILFSYVSRLKSILVFLWSFGPTSRQITKGASCSDLISMAFFLFGQVSSLSWPFNILSRLHLIWCAFGELAHLRIPTDHHILLLFNLGCLSHQRGFLIRAEKRVQLSGASHCGGVKGITSDFVCCWRKMWLRLWNKIWQDWPLSFSVHAHGATCNLTHFNPPKSKKA